MCLYINKRYHPHRKALVAQEDILVYKCLKHVCGNTYKSPYFFCYWLPVKGRMEMLSSFQFEGSVITKGIHAYKYSSKYNGRYDTDQHYAIIPKGTKFYIGTYQDVVSNELIVFEKLKDYSNYKQIKAQCNFRKDYKTPTIKTYIKKWLKPE